MALPTDSIAAPQVATPTIHSIDHKEPKHFLENPPEHAVSEPATSSVPIINLGALDNPSTRTTIVENISKASADWGLFLIINHGIEPSIMDEMLAAAKAFFALPLEKKMKYTAEENTDLINYVPQPPHCWREFLYHSGHHAAGEIVRLWPSEASNYKEATKHFLMANWELAKKLAGAISEGLAKEKGYLEGTLKEELQYIACNYYPPCPQPHLVPGVGAHTDRCAIAVLVHNEVDGLEVWHEGKWVPVPQAPGALVVFVGESMRRLSEERYEPALHRVVANETMARFSVAVGNGPKN